MLVVARNVLAVLNVLLLGLFVFLSGPYSRLTWVKILFVIGIGLGCLMLYAMRRERQERRARFRALLEERKRREYG